MTSDSLPPAPGTVPRAAADSETQPFAPFQPAPPEAAPPEPVRPAIAVRARPAAGSRWLNVALGAALLVAVAGVAFAVGRATAPASAGTATTGNGFGGFGNGNGFPGREGSFDPNGRGNGLGGGGLSIEGTVESVTADALTVRTASGQTITIGLGSGTAYHRQADASAADITTGSTVVVRVGGFRPGNGNGNGGTATLGTASDVTVVP